MLSLHDRLVSAMTEEDRRDEARARKTGRHFNHYRLAHLIGAAQRATEACSASQDAQLFARHVAEQLCAAPWLTRYFLSIGVNVVVERGEYYFQAERNAS